MRQGIVTKYHGPTNSKGSRVHAVARKRQEFSNHVSPALQLTDSWDHAHGVEENHCRVAQLLATKLGWHGLWIGGGSPDNAGYVWVLIEASADILADPGMVDAMGIAGRDWFLVKATKA